MSCYLFRYGQLCACVFVWPVTMFRLRNWFSAALSALKVDGIYGRWPFHTLPNHALFLVQDTWVFWWSTLKCHVIIICLLLSSCSSLISAHSLDGRSQR